MFTCPHCKQNSISLLAKYSAGYWRWITCSHCQYRLSANPIALALLQMLYFWVLMYFGYLTMQVSTQYIFWGVGAWLALDALNVWLTPLTFLNRKT